MAAILDFHSAVFFIFSYILPQLYSFCCAFVTLSVLYCEQDDIKKSLQEQYETIIRRHYGEYIDVDSFLEDNSLASLINMDELLKNPEQQKKALADKILKDASAQFLHFVTILKSLIFSDFCLFLFDECRKRIYSFPITQLLTCKHDESFFMYQIVTVHPYSPTRYFL